MTSELTRQAATSCKAGRASTLDGGYLRMYGSGGKGLAGTGTVGAGLALTGFPTFGFILLGPRAPRRTGDVADVGGPHPGTH